MASCIERIREIADGNFSNEETSRILKDIENDLADKEALSDASGEGLQAVIKSNTEKLEKSVEQENFLLANEELQVARSADIYKNFEIFKKNPLKVFGDSLTTGTARGPKAAGSRTYLTKIHAARMAGRFSLDGVISSVKDGLQTLKSAEYESQIVDAINGKEGNNKIANELGKKVAELREVNNKKLERHGIVTTRLKDRGNHQTHNATKLLNSADTKIGRTKVLLSTAREVDRAGAVKTIAFNRWRDTIHDLLDLGRTFGAKTALDTKAMNLIYREIYDSITSNVTSNGSKSVQQMVNSSRFFHFKDAISQIKYNTKYGAGSLFDSLMQEADSTGARIGTLELTGNRPLEYIDKTIRLAAKKSSRVFTKDEVNTAVAEARFKMRQSIGINTNTHGLSGALVKAVQKAAFASVLPHLAALVAVNDLAPALDVMANVGGKGVFKSSIQMFKNAKNILTDDAVLKEYTQQMGLKRDLFLGGTNKFSGLENGDLSGKLMSFMMKLSPHEFMNYLEGMSSAHEITLMLGSQSKVGFDKLPGKLSKILDFYGIDSGRWDLMRKGKIDIGGRTHVTLDSLRNLKDEDIKDFLKKKFNLKKVSDFRVEQERDQTQQLYSQMITDKMATASNLVDARQNLWKGRFDTSTPLGKAQANVFSLFGSLRYYQTAIVQRTLAPKIFGESGESVMHQIMGRKFDKIGLARWAAVSFTLGVIGFNFESLLEGKVPDESEIIAKAGLSPLGILGQGFELGSGFGRDALNLAIGPAFKILGNVTTDIAKVVRGDNPVHNATKILTDGVAPFNNSLSRKGMAYLMGNQLGNMHRG